MAEQVTFPGAVAPDRRYDVDSNGIRIAVHEWGDGGAPPLMLVHGGFDFARTFDVFAPKFAAIGWRVVSWDHRGHGDSEHAELYSWDADLRDAVAVFDHVAGAAAVPVIGHSKGGALMTQLADAHPFRFASFVNIDGIPHRRPIPDLAEHDRTKMLTSELTGWLDHRRSTATARRKPGTLDELARRRGRMNPRLSHDWLRYLVSVGADGVRRRLAMEARPDDAHGRLRPVAAGVGAACACRAWRCRSSACSSANRRTWAGAPCRTTSSRSSRPAVGSRCSTASATSRTSNSPT